jgi:ATP-dependent DNA helicase RecQ
MVDDLLKRALLIDLEVSPRGKILKIGAVLGDQTLSRSGAAPWETVSLALTELARGASWLLGHNLVRHDLPILRTVAPELGIHRLPVIDTLVLSPICFPENPYHRLVKDYKLVRESLNDPVADARQAAALFADEFQSLSGLRQKDPRLFEILHFLLATPDDEGDRLSEGMTVLLRALGGVMPARERALDFCRELVPQWGCASVPIDETLVQTQSARMALAYTLTWLRVAGSNSVLPPWVRLEHPRSGELIKRLREVPCNSADCSYCRRVHNAKEQLRAFFGFDSFRPLPQSSTGGACSRTLWRPECGMNRCWPFCPLAAANRSVTRSGVGAELSPGCADDCVLAAASVDERPGG